MDKRIINERSIEKVKHLIKKSSQRPLMIYMQDDAFNRKIIEHGKFDVLVYTEKEDRKNTLRQKDSGLNKYLAREMVKNKISFGIDIEYIREKDKKEKAILIGRTIQNIKIARKVKLSLAIFGSKDNKDSKSFIMSIGASSEQAHKAIYF